jgi:WXG100 family type VII secretion target
MSDKVQADYQQLEQLAGKFSAQSQIVQSMLQKVNSHFSDLAGGGWIGRGSEAFISEMNGEVLPATQRLIDALEEGQQVTRQIIQIMRQAEQEASSRFRS